MTDTGTQPAVALLFADGELGAQLRDALTGLGARIVHEGPAAEVSGEVLAASGADVVVVNLEPAEASQLDGLYDILDSGPYQVVFNDAEASRHLSGWDRARWARHLAAKLVGSSDVDPPRPAAGLGAGPTVDADAALPAASVDEAVPTIQAALAAERVAAGPHDVGSAAAADGMALELEPVADARADVPAGDATADQPAVDIEARTTVDDLLLDTDWELTDPDAPPPAPEPPREDPRDFGVEKMRAEDYLAPDNAVDDSPVEPGIDLELVSLEESIAPTMYDGPVSEMMLGEGMGSVRRVVAVGAGADGTAATNAFLAGLPDTLPALVLLVQHQREGSLDELVTTLDVTADLPVRAARNGTAVKHGQVWVIPAGQTCRVGRDGVIRLSAIGTTLLGNPSIDECMTALAGVFRADLTAVILAGTGYDALAGTQEVHDYGGRVWVQDPATCGDDAMAAAIHAEGLATFSGTPEELAQHLAGEYA